MTNVEALRNKISELGMSITFVAEKSGILRETLYNRLNTGDFKLSEICKISDTLNLSVEERNIIFFGNDSELNSANKNT